MIRNLAHSLSGTARPRRGVVRSLLDRACDLLARHIDGPTVAEARGRHAAVLEGRSCDYLPIVFARPVRESAHWRAFSWAERFHDPDKSLYMQIKDILLPRVAAGGDYVPGVRADLGTINCQTVLGAKYLVPEHTRTVISEYVPKAELAAWEAPDDVSSLGTMPRVIEHMAHHRSVLAAWGLDDLVDVYHCDQQGPFDIAAMTRGHEIFLDLYEDEAFVHGLMDKCTQVYVAVSKLCRQITGQGEGGANAAGIWLEGGGVRMCGDSDILVSAEQFRRFIQPYHQRAFDALGGGWLHYCGGWPRTGRSEGVHLHEAYAEIDGLGGLNWSTAGDWIEEMRRLPALGLAHIGTVPRGPGEPLAAYFRRVLGACDGRRGLIFTPAWEAQQLSSEAPEAVVETWRSAQDELFAAGAGPES